MMVTAFSEFFSGHSPVCATALPFNPIKLVLLIAWVYLCLYIVQFIQFSSLVSKKYRPTVSLLALCLGPVVLILLIIVDTIRKSSSSGRGMFEVLREGLENLIEHITSARAPVSDKESDITLLDTSGRNIKEVYTHGRSKSQDRKIVDFTKQVILNALNEQASDILIDARDSSTYSIRYRVDGVLRIAEEVDSDVSQAVINSIKAVSGMDIAERRRPQDGAFIAKTASRTASFRVASAGAVHGEKLSVRILGQDAGTFTLKNVGLTEKQRRIIEDAVKKPSGMILMCGPTGSGKTTTLYGMLNEMDLLTRNVITVEDPVEYVLENASQIEVNPKADITFAKALRSILRQDPDVICVGEIRDEETAAVALRAAQTGHLVLATVHCGTNAAALVRLLDLGVSPLLMSSGLSLIISQQLLRRLCKACKVRAELSKNEIQDFASKGINYRNIFQPKGCSRCHGTGYQGRTAIFDILVLNDALKASIAKNDMLIGQLRKTGEKKGKSNLHKQGLKKVVSGTTSLEELKRVLG